MNYIIQIIWICVFAVLGTVSIINEQYTMWLLLLSFFLGLNHIVVSLLDVVVNKRNATFKFHFLGSVIYLAILLLGYMLEQNMGMHFPEGGIIGDLVPIMGIGVPVVLAIYFWYLSLKDGYPYSKREHDVFEL